MAAQSSGLRLECLALLSAAALAALPARAESPGPRIDLSSCPVPGVAETAQCGTLEVPENRDLPDGRRIALKVMVIPAIEPKGAAPLFDLAGGPGMAATIGADFYLTAGRAMRAHRDVVLVDQRGTGASTPLRCKELEAVSPVARMYPPADVDKCRAELASGHDLTRYATADAVRDLEAVREALGAEQIDLFGISYGTRLGQAYIRAHPSRVRSAAFLGTVPIDLRTPLEHAQSSERTLRDIFADCAADAACGAAYPRLAEEWEAVLARFADGPVIMHVGDSPLPVERGPFAEALRATMTTDSGQRRLPALIHAAAGGDFAPFMKAVGSGGSSMIAEGLYLSVECAESAPRITETDIAASSTGTFLGRYRVDEQLGACRRWPRREIDEAFFEPVTSEVPVLFLAGGRDHVAPPRYTEAVARGFSRSRIVLIEEMPHFAVAMSNLECLDAMLLEFYASADAGDVDTSCVASMKAPSFDLTTQP
jgi:pimeloyl-ACP methyl ester carboxylesterase